MYGNKEPNYGMHGDPAGLENADEYVFVRFSSSFFLHDFAQFRLGYFGFLYLVLFMDKVRLYLVHSLLCTELGQS